MAIGPILPGRLPNSLAASRLSQNVESNKLELQKLQDQLTTGHQYQTLSQSPAKALRTIIYQKDLERKEQFVANVQTDRSMLNASEDALVNVGDAINSTKSLLLQGLGAGAGATEREALANEVSTLITSITNSGNTKFRGRFLFGGSQSAETPFDVIGSGQVRYRGDAAAIESFLNYDIKVTNNIDGITAFNALSTVNGDDLNVGLHVETRIADLHGGTGVELGTINVSVSDGVTTNAANIDLTGAESIEDIQTRIETAFASSGNPVTVDIEPTTQSGLRITPMTGTVAVTDLAGSRVAADLGLSSSETAVLNGRDLNPRLGRHTNLLSLNGGSGIGPTSGFGLKITVGERSQTVDLSGVQTVEDLFNTLKLSGLDLSVGFTADGSGLSISSRVSGVPFSIGENNGQNASLLGLRTMRATTPLSELNQNVGTQTAAGNTLTLTRRDGSTTEIDLANTVTVQDVLDRVNAADPGRLSAMLNPVGNGIALYDNSGAGPLSVVESPLAESLGLVGSETSSDPAIPLAGRDVNTRQSDGILSLLGQLESALRKGDVRDLGRLNGKLDLEADRFFTLRGLVGTRQRALDESETRLGDEQVLLNEGLSESFDVDLAAVITAYTARQQTLEATYQVVSRTQNLNLLSFL